MGFYIVMIKSNYDFKLCWCAYILFDTILIHIILLYTCVHACFCAETILNENCYEH